MARLISAFIIGLLLCLAADLIAAPVHAAHPATPEEGSQEKAEKGDASEINKQLTNPVSQLWSIQFQQNNFRLSPGIGFDQGERWSSNLLLQPVLPVALTPNWNLITRPVIPLFVSQPHPQAADPTHVDRTTAFGDIILLEFGLGESPFPPPRRRDDIPVDAPPGPTQPLQC